MCPIKRGHTKPPQQQTMLVQCWAIVCAAGPTLNQHWLNILCVPLCGIRKITNYRSDILHKAGMIESGVLTLSVLYDSYQLFWKWVIGFLCHVQYAHKFLAYFYFLLIIWCVITCIKSDSVRHFIQYMLSANEWWNIDLSRFLHIMALWQYRDRNKSRSRDYTVLLFNAFDCVCF